jgi:manganese/iron transport system ATP-binding protein
MHLIHRSQAVCVQQLCVAYGTRTVVSEVTFNIAHGEVVALIGPNGAGKSSVMKAMAGLVRFGGSIEYCPLAGTIGGHAHSATVAYIPQRQDLDLSFPIRIERLVLSGRRRLGGCVWRPGLADRTAAYEAMERVGITALARRPIGGVSGGQLQRALIARALCQGADVLLLDEAMSGIDRPTAIELCGLLNGLGHEGVACLVASHDLHMVRERFKRCIALNGSVVVDGAPSLVLQADAIEATFARVG